jgi:hypothetical protein
MSDDLSQIWKSPQSGISSRLPRLMLQAEKALPEPIRPDLLACCPTMDMVAIINKEQQLEVYRINGQKAFGRKRKSPDATVDSLCWKFNGTNNNSRRLPVSRANRRQANI